LSELIGHVDERERPLIRVALPEEGGSFRAVVDTGFNGWLMMESADVAGLGFPLSDIAASVELAEGGRRRLAVAHGEIMWFGRRHRIDVLVSSIERECPIAADEPVALVGTRLLSPHRLEIDFERRLVKIEARD
jgi:predicted aspartyl protease